MQNSDNQRQPIGFPLTITVFLALVLMLVSLPDTLYYFWPDWMLLLVIFWSSSARDSFGPTLIVFMGLLVDVLFVRTFGVLSLGFLFVAFFVSRASHQFHAMTTWQQCFIVGLLTAILKLITGWLYGIVGDFNYTMPFWYSILGNMIAWPFVAILFSELRRFARTL